MHFVPLDRAAQVVDRLCHSDRAAEMDILNSGSTNGFLIGAQIHCRHDVNIGPNFAHVFGF
jgi:hypothetical protein